MTVITTEHIFVFFTGTSVEGAQQLSGLILCRQKQYVCWCQAAVSHHIKAIQAGFKSDKQKMHIGKYTINNYYPYSDVTINTINPGT